MPYTYKNTGKRFEYMNSSKSTKSKLKIGIKEIIRGMLKEDENVIMRTKVETDSIENLLNSNVGIPFDAKEKQEIIFKQGTLGIKSTIQRNGTEIKFSTSDMFGNNKINVIKKLKNMSDPNTLVYANFFSVASINDESAETPEQSPSPSSPDKQNTEQKANKTFIKLSQPFEDKGSDKLDILSDFIQLLDI